MRRQMTVAAALLLFSCARKEEGPGLSIEAAPQEIARAVCPKAYVCCTPMQLKGNDLAGTDEASCEVKTTQGFRNNLNGLKGAIQKGRVRYDGEKMAACLAHIRAASCETLNRTNHFSGIGCDPYVIPLVAPGGACGGDAECIDGTCKKAEEASEGTCQALPRSGESCADVRCAKGFVCNGNTRLCEAELPEKTMCVAGGECGSGTCVGPDGGTGSCAPASNQCFYASSCSYGRAPLTGGVALAALALLGLGARRRLGWRSRRS